MAYTYNFPRPAVTVDCIIYQKNTAHSYEVLLIKRAKDPFKNQWALPGGFLELDEELEAAARRELFEETGIVHLALQQLFTVGTLGRDPRHRTISVIYGGSFDENSMKISAGDDAAAAQWFAIDKLPKLAFDHNEVIRKAFAEFISDKT
jgi:8-oxo-dGTP diphosphatase